MGKGISPLIAAVIMVALVIAVVGMASTFFTGFTKETKESVKTKSASLMDCAVAEMEVHKSLVNVGPKTSVVVENIGNSEITGLKLVLYNSTGAYEMDPSPDSLGINDVKTLQVSYPGEPVLNKLVVSSTSCPGLKDEAGFTYSYQENADETNCTGNTCDGNWSTSSGATGEDFSLNYTKPADSVGAKWQVKTSSLNNYTMPSDCWSYDKRELILGVSEIGGSMYEVYCYNGTWKVIYAAETGFYEEAVWWNVLSD